VTALVSGDPASVSSLGADLARQAERVRAQHLRLSGRRVGMGSEDHLHSSLAAHLQLLDACADALSDAGRALQDYAVDLQLARSHAAEAEEFCARHGLRVDRSVVTLPPGVYPVDEAAAYSHHVPDAQRLVDRALEEREDAVRTLDGQVAAPMAVLRGTGRAVDEALP
jgi:hypothetical protein